MKEEQPIKKPVTLKDTMITSSKLVLFFMILSLVTNFIFKRERIQQVLSEINQAPNKLLMILLLIGSFLVIWLGLSAAFGTVYYLIRKHQKEY